MRAGSARGCARTLSTLSALRMGPPAEGCSKGSLSAVVHDCCLATDACHAERVAGLTRRFRPLTVCPFCYDVLPDRTSLVLAPGRVIDAAGGMAGLAACSLRCTPARDRVS